MKKLTAMFLTLLMVVSFAACNSSPGEISVSSAPEPAAEKSGAKPAAACSSIGSARSAACPLWS